MSDARHDHQTGETVAPEHSADDGPPPTDPFPIRAVTVYPDRARITRRGRLDLAPGERRLRLGGLPLTVDPESVRVSGAGAGVRLVAVDVSTSFGADGPSPGGTDPVQRLRDELDRCADALQAADDEGRVITGRIDFLERAAERAARSLTRGSTPGRADLTHAGEMLGSLHSDLLAARRQAAVAQRHAARELDAARKRLETAVTGPEQQHTAIEVTLEAREPVTVEAEISYVTLGAGWQATHDIHVGEDRMLLEHHGLVRQTTGEPWTGVALTLSTARPATASRIPELEPWDVDVFRPPVPRPLARQAAPMAEMAALGVADAMASPPAGGVGPPADAAPALWEDAATAATAGPSATYAVGGESTIPPDGTARRVLLGSSDLPARLDRVAAPITCSEVVIRARATNTSPHTLLAGNAAIHYDDRYVGRTWLDLLVPGEELDVALGADDLVRAERDLVQRDVSKSLVGSARRISLEYKTTVQNHRAIPVTVNLLDRLPLSRSEDVRIRNVRVDPAPTERTDLEQLTWEFTLAPGEDREFRLAFTLEHPRHLTVTGLDP